MLLVLTRFKNVAPILSAEAGPDGAPLVLLRPGATEELAEDEANVDVVIKHWKQLGYKVVEGRRCYFPFLPIPLRLLSKCLTLFYTPYG